MPRVIAPFKQFFDGVGNPLVDGKLRFLVSGTNNTDKDTFKDAGETIKNTNPVILDGEGRCPNVFGTGAYRVISFTKDDAQIQEFDPVGGELTEGFFADWNSSTIYGIGDVVTGNDGKYYRSLVANNQNQDPTVSPDKWEEVQFVGIWNANVTYNTNDIVSYQGVFYASAVDNNLGNVPLGDTTNWKSTAAPAAVIGSISVRNSLLTPEPLSQPGAGVAGISAVIYTGNGTSQNVNNGLDMASGDNGGLVWIKSRSGARDHALTDTVRGPTNEIKSNSTAAEAVVAGGLTAFLNNGFTVGNDIDYNNSGENYVAWCFKTTKKITGNTPQGKPYTCHFNPYLGFSIIGYEGNGIRGHEIPHYLGRKPELIIFKNRSILGNWIVKRTETYDNNNVLQLNLTNTEAAVTDTLSIVGNDSIFLDTRAIMNGDTNNHIAYAFSSIPGVVKVGRYQGEGQPGKLIKCGFKPGLVIVKGIDTAQSWAIHDAVRPDAELLADTAAIEQTARDNFDFVDDGFILKSAFSVSNALNTDYLFIAFSQEAIDAAKFTGNYPQPTDVDALTVKNPTLMAFANGFSETGQVDAVESVAGGVISFGAGFENKRLYIYRDRNTAFGVTENRPLTGLNRNVADRWGVPSPLAASLGLRTTEAHNNYQSPTGIASASGEYATGSSFAYNAFNKILLPGVGSNGWLIAATTNSWLQYKSNEPRILKSWRFEPPNGNTTGATNEARAPRRFSIQGSNDGITWTDIDTTYAAADYTTIENGKFGPLQDVSGNTTPYLYHRINITANNGDATYTGIGEFELNTKIATDWFNVDEAKLFNDAGTRLDRVYIGECVTDKDGHVVSFINYTASKQKFNDVEIHGDLDVFGKINGSQQFDAWVRIDGNANPPKILASYNVADVVDDGAGQYDVVFETPMDNDNYGVVFGIGDPSQVKIGYINPSNLTKTRARVVTYSTTFALADAGFVTIGILGGKSRSTLK